MGEWTKLKELRKSAGLSREALAKSAGVSPTQIYRLESGENDRSRAAYSTIAALARALNVDASELVSGEHPEALFAQRIEDMDLRDLAILRREAGRPMQDASSSRAYMVFYKNLPTGAVDMNADDDLATDVWYQIGCIIADGVYRQRSHETAGPVVTLPAAVGRIAAESDADYLQHRLMNALGTAWTDDGTAAQLVQKLARLAVQEGYRIDWPALLCDAQHWNDSDQDVTRRWAEEYHASKAEH